MQQIYLDKRLNDKACVTHYQITNPLLMENAGGNLARFIAKILKKSYKSKHFALNQTQQKSNIFSQLDKSSQTPKIVLLIGNGDNGADGIVCARILKSILPCIPITLIILKEPKSKLCKEQFQILSNMYPSLFEQQATHLPFTFLQHYSQVSQDCIHILPYYDFFEWIERNDRENQQMLYNGNHAFLQDLEKICKDSKQHDFYLAILKLLENHYPTLHAESIQKQAYLYHTLFLESKQDSNLAQVHYRIFQNILQSLQPCDILIDCIFGSGFNNENKPIQSLNYRALQRDFAQCRAVKIACDVPSGLSNILGYYHDISDILGSFDYTYAMGAMSVSLFDSRLKDKVGIIKKGLLGFESRLYHQCLSLDSNNTNHITLNNTNSYNNNTSQPHKQFLEQYFLLEKKDLALPHRTQQNSNKGSYGTAYIIGGEMFGAVTLSAFAAQSFGTGKVCVYEGFLKQEYSNKECEIIYTKTLPSIHATHATKQAIRDSKKSLYFSFYPQQNRESQYAFAVGMGLGYDETQYAKLFLHMKTLLHLELDIESSNEDSIQSDIPIVFDADILYRKELIALLPFLNQAVLTPHPKEFFALLQNADILDSQFDFDFVLRNIPRLALAFSQKYPHIVCHIKGANTTIAYDNRIYIHTLGHANLAKGGSGDVLSGMIVGLLSQGYTNINACIQASLAHALASQKALKKYDSYALTPLKLIESIATLARSR